MSFTIPFLDVTAQVILISNAGGREIGGAYRVEVSYSKRVEDAWGHSRRATTWSRGRIGYGPVENLAGTIMQIVSEQLDRFILEYLRVNEEAC